MNRLGSIILLTFTIPIVWSLFFATSVHGAPQQQSKHLKLEEWINGKNAHIYHPHKNIDHDIHPQHLSIKDKFEGVLPNEQYLLEHRASSSSSSQRHRNLATVSVATELELNIALQTSGTTISLTSSINLTSTVYVLGVAGMTLNGNGHVMDGQGALQCLLISYASISINSLTISNGLTVIQQREERERERAQQSNCSFFPLSTSHALCFC
jgi:hypothetical protein